jgi:shikimate kinase
MPDPQSIALIGLSGVGKSSVGRLLAARLGWPLLDTDTLIAESAGRTVAQIFADSGEPHFRDLEVAALQHAFSIAPCVVSTGGGIVLRPENRALLRARAFVVWLDAPTEVLVARLLAHDEARPLIGGDEPAARLESLRGARADLYAQVAHARLDAAGCAAEDVCLRVLELIPHASSSSPA